MKFKGGGNWNFSDKTTHKIYKKKMQSGITTEPTKI